jgi:eukaryotic-like serine/threonine-protein kinase
VRKRGSAKILDFGLAKGRACKQFFEQDCIGKHRDSDDGRTAPDQPRLCTRHRCLYVTGQVRVKALDARTDLFSFGAVLYEMATGMLPFCGESSGVIFEFILNRAPTSPVRLNPDLPAELERIISKCLEKHRHAAVPARF